MDERGKVKSGPFGKKKQVKRDVANQCIVIQWGNFKIAY